MQFLRLHSFVLLAAAMALQAGSVWARDVKVAVTSKPIHSLVAAVMRDAGEPTLIIEGSASPHTFTLRPSGARAIYAADIVFRVSEALEPFTRKIAQSLPAEVKLISLADAPGVRSLPLRTGATFGTHVHAGDVTDVDGHEGHEHEASARAVDPHVWLNPGNAKAMVNEIAKDLSAIYPEHAKAFLQNAIAVVAKIDALDQSLIDKLRPIKGRPFIVFHDATQYFEHHYGLAAAGSITISPDVQPSAKRLTEVRSKIKALGAVCVFAEPHFQPRLVAAVSDGTLAKTATIDPAGLMLSPGPDLYFNLMQGMASSLVECLQ